MKFSNEKFEARQPNDRLSLLKIQGDPSGFIASQFTPGKLTVRTRQGLTVAAGRSLLFVGGDVTFEESLIQISAPTAQRTIDIGGLAEAGEILLTRQDNLLNLSYAQNLVKSNILLDNSQVQVLTGSGGNLVVNARNLTLKNNSELIVGVIGGANFPNAKAGDLNLNITDSISILSGSKVSNEVPPIARAKVTAGDVNINTRRLIVENSIVRSDVFRDGTAGTLRINALESIQLVGEFPISPVNPNSDPAKVGPGGLFAQVNKGATNSQGGTIDINTPKLILRDGAKIQTAVFGEGKRGH
ncbi:MAG: hypothetical protein HC780_29645 [Leptolyngbyaceae cyanobacterium CSU_1_3]|nr:hypothetical protein [Leptolyngbyaceae cyanobacterium CSU_1_3]